MLKEKLGLNFDFRPATPPLIGLDISSSAGKMDELNLDFQVIGPAPNNPEEVEVLIAASRKEKVEDRVAVAETAGLKTVVMDVDSYATLEAFGLIAPQLPANGRDQNIAIVDIGAHMMHFYVIRNGQQLFSREQSFGGNQ